MTKVIDNRKKEDMISIYDLINLKGGLKLIQIPENDNVYLVTYNWNGDYYLTNTLGDGFTVRLEEIGLSPDSKVYIVNAELKFI